MSFQEKDDMDVVVHIWKIGKSSKPMLTLNYYSLRLESEVPDTCLAKLYRLEGYLHASHLPSCDEKRSSPDG
jgi:hypothetical protein